ncbi:MAG: hypothetical protein PWP58_1552, partial [Bacillota bacterium]|nr:hypothetical protein [Bacillota bacterium]
AQLGCLWPAPGFGDGPFPRSSWLPCSERVLLTHRASTPPQRQAEMRHYTYVAQIISVMISRPCPAVNRVENRVIILFFSRLRSLGRARK